MLSIAATTIVAILVGVVELSKINFASNNIGAAVQDLGKIFGAALGKDGLLALFAKPSRIPEVLLAILAFSLTDIFDNIGTLISTGRKAGIFNIADEEAAKDSSGFRLKWTRRCFQTWLGQRLVRLQELQMSRLM